MTQCTAHSKRTGERCKNQAVQGRNVCRMHGGLTPVGRESPHFIHGRYSRFLPDRMTARYAEATADPRLLELRDEVALLDARLAELIRRVDSGESGALWRQLGETWGALEAARDSNDAGALRVALATMGRLINRGVADYGAWADIRTLIEQRRKIVESERRRLVEMQSMISTERALLLMGAVVDIIRRHVLDPDQLSAIGREMQALTLKGSEPAEAT